MKATCIVLLLSGLLAGCSLPSKFDARDPGSIDLTGPGSVGSGGTHCEEPDFTGVDIMARLTPEDLKPAGGPYRVGPGDVLDIEVAEVASSRSQITIMPDGMIYYDVAGGVNVTGKTLKEISHLLTEKLKSNYAAPVVTVNIASADSQRFWVLGQVRKPGAYPVTRPTSLVQALSLAGGLQSGQLNAQGDTQEPVDLDRAILVRKGKLIPVNFKSLINEGDMSQNVYVRGGDYVYLPSIQHRAVYVLGHVANPGPVYFDSDLSMVSALASAGGPKSDAVVTKALIIRGSLHTPKVAVVNYRDVVSGRKSDVRLQGGDIIWVPKGVWSKLNEYVETVLVTAAQAVAVQEGLSAVGAAAINGAGVSISAGQ